MQHIGIDCRFSCGHSGIARYCRELVPALLAQDHQHSYTLFVRSTEEEWIAHLPGNAKICVAPFAPYSFAEQWKFPSLLRTAGIDLLFVPHFNVPLRCPVPFVVTIHDLILHRYPNQASLLRQIAYRFSMRKAVQRSSRIIAVSSFTAEEVRRTYGEHIAEKTTVIQEAVSSQFTPRSTEEQEAVRSRYHLPKTFLLYVGNAKQHKNLPVLLAAFRQAQLQETALVLVTGEKEASRLHTGTNVQRIESVREEDLPALYSASRAFVTASLYEGFCFPLLEAAACGCPVLAVNGSAIAEVAPPGAVLVEPMVASFAAAFKHLPAPAPSPSLHSRTWKHVAEETLSVLRK